MITFDDISGHFVIAHLLVHFCETAKMSRTQGKYSIPLAMYVVYSLCAENVFFTLILHFLYSCSKLRSLALIPVIPLGINIAVIPELSLTLVCALIIAPRSRLHFWQPVENTIKCVHEFLVYRVITGVISQSNVDI